MKLDETLDLDLRIQKAPESDDYQVAAHCRDANTALHGLAQAIEDIGIQTGWGTQKILCQLTVILFKRN